MGLPAAGIVAGAGAAALLVHDPRPWGRRLLRAGALVAGVVAVAFAASGWFWLRSRHLYGDIAGSAYNLDRFGYGPRGTTAELLPDPHWPATLARQLWGRIYDDAEFAVGRWAIPGLFVVALVVAGALCLAVEALRRGARPAPRLWRSWSAAERGRALAWALCMSPAIIKKLPLIAAAFVSLNKTEC